MPDDDMIFVAGARLENGNLLTSGGRVLGVTATAENLQEAITAAYQKVKTVSFDNAFYRSDIGKRALEVL